MIMIIATTIVNLNFANLFNGFSILIQTTEYENADLNLDYFYLM